MKCAEQVGQLLLGKPLAWNENGDDGKCSQVLAPLCFITTKLSHIC